MCADPAAYGIANAVGPIVEALQLGLDETPLLYNAACKKTMTVPEVCNPLIFPKMHFFCQNVEVATSEDKQVRVANIDKRSATATPVTSRAGELILVQIIFRGKTDRCHPSLGPNDSKQLYCDHSESKYQTTGTSGVLMAKSCICHPVPLPLLPWTMPLAMPMPF